MLLGDHIMQENKNKIDELKKQILIAEEGLEAAKRALFELTKNNPSENGQPDYNSQVRAYSGGNIIEGVFNGENMIGPGGKIYPVPANYASKSKLVEGDGLKLTITEEGRFIFKQISPAKRRTIKGILKFEDNAYHVLADGHSYKILYASVTYHKGKPGDQVTIIIPENVDSEWAALESIIHDVDLQESNNEPSSDSSKGAEAPMANPEELATDVTPSRPIDIQDRQGLKSENQNEGNDLELTNQQAPEENVGSVDQNMAGETKEEDLKRKLSIDDINIGSPKKIDTPQEVSAAEVPNSSNRQRTVIQPSQNQTKQPNSPQSISEMDI